MRSKWAQRISAVAALALLLGGTLGARPASPISESEKATGNWYYVDRSSTLLQNLKQVAAKLNQHAETLSMIQRNPQVSWQTHSEHLNQVRDQINDAGKLLRELQGMRESVAPWQRHAIDRVAPVAADVATHTTAAINHLNENRRSITFTEYRDKVQRLADSSSEMKDRINNYLDYAETKQELQQLQTRLGVENL